MISNEQQRQNGRLQYMSNSDIPKILVCGGRDYADWFRLRDTLEKIIDERVWISESDECGNYLPRVVIISGAAKGADQMAIEWAVVNWCPFEEYPADWKKYGTRAGPIRNQQMLDKGKPDLVVAFPGGNGTKDMVRRAKKAGVEVIEIN